AAAYQGPGIQAPDDRGAAETLRTGRRVHVAAVSIRRGPGTQRLAAIGASRRRHEDPRAPFSLGPGSRAPVAGADRSAHAPVRGSARHRLRGALVPPGPDHRAASGALHTNYDAARN